MAGNIASTPATTSPSPLNTSQDRPFIPTTEPAYEFPTPASTSTPPSTPLDPSNRRKTSTASSFDTHTASHSTTTTGIAAPPEEDYAGCFIPCTEPVYATSVYYRYTPTPPTRVVPNGNSQDTRKSSGPVGRLARAESTTGYAKMLSFEEEEEQAMVDAWNAKRPRGVPGSVGLRDVHRDVVGSSSEEEEGENVAGRETGEMHVRWAGMPRA